MTKIELRKEVARTLDATMAKLNDVLTGHNVAELEPVLNRLGRGQQLPHWYEQLRAEGTLPNLDGKTIGSVIEMLLVSILETSTLRGKDIGELNINPARGVDIPDLDLGIKSPSENYCTSEPFFSAYERLLGNEHDLVVLLTDYQTAKKKPPLRVQLIKWKYLEGSEIADMNLCAIAKKHREWLLHESENLTKKVFKFLSYVNQSDWRARYIVKLIAHLENDAKIKELVINAAPNFAMRNDTATRRGRGLLPDSDLRQVLDILEVNPLSLGVVNAADDWVIETHKDFGRYPNDNEWERLKSGPLNGKIGMSFALQWRYNFGPLFRNEGEEGDPFEETAVED